MPVSNGARPSITGLWPRHSWITSGSWRRARHQSRPQCEKSLWERSPHTLMLSRSSSLQASPCGSSGPTLALWDYTSHSTLLSLPRRYVLLSVPAAVTNCIADSVGPVTSRPPRAEATHISTSPMHPSWQYTRMAVMLHLPRKNAAKSTPNLPRLHRLPAVAA